MSKGVTYPPDFKRLFYDIEVSGNIGTFWRPSYKTSIPYQAILIERAIICISYKWANEDKVQTLVWDKGDDKKLLKDFVKILNEAHEIIGHNADKFDLRWIRGRCMKHRIEMRHDYVTYDTLKMFKGGGSKGANLNSYRLDYIGKYLGLGEKIHTDHTLWRDITIPALLPNYEKIGKKYHNALKQMVAYCEQDVLLLENVFNLLRPYTPNKANAAASIDDHPWNCRNCSSGNVVLNGTYATANGVRKHRMICQDCRCQYVISAKTKRDYLQWQFDRERINLQ